MDQDNSEYRHLSCSIDNVTKQNIKEHNPNWPQIPDHLYKMLIIGGPGSGSSDMDYFYKNIGQYSLNKKHKLSESFIRGRKLNIFLVFIT